VTVSKEKTMKHVRTAVLLTVVALLAACVSAPPAPKGVSGEVLWNGVPLEGVTVKLVVAPGDASSSWVAKAVTDGRGTYFLEGVAPGRYTVYAMAPTDDYVAWTGFTFDVSTSGSTRVPSFSISKKIGATAPAPGGTVTAMRPTLSWTPVAEAATYHVDVFLGRDPYTQVVNQDLGNVTSFTIAVDLVKGESYQWAVYGRNPAGLEVGTLAGSQFSLSR
jgi:hypothetical protein